MAIELVREIGRRLRRRGPRPAQEVGDRRMVAPVAAGTVVGRVVVSRQGAVVERESDLLGDRVVNGPQRRHDGGRPDPQERLGDPAVVPEEVLAGSHLAGVEEHERRASRQVRTADLEGIDRRAAHEVDALPGALRVVSAVDGEVEDVRWRGAAEQGINQVRLGVDRRRLVAVLDDPRLLLGRLEALERRARVDTPDHGHRRGVNLPRRVGRRGALVQDPAPDVRLGTQVVRRRGVERLVDPGQLPRDVRLLGQEQDVERARGHGGVGGRDRSADGRWHLVADDLADPLEQLRPAMLLALDVQLADDRGRELLGIVTDVAFGRRVARKPDAGQVRFDAPLERALVEAALDRDRDVGRWLARRRGDVRAGCRRHGFHDLDRVGIGGNDDLAGRRAEGLAVDRERGRDAPNRLRCRQIAGGEVDDD